ncbi:MAG: hypothetical protein ABI649_05035 [Gaiellaceae bacterium]
MFRRKLEASPDFPIDRDEVIEIFWALAKIHANTLKTIAILRGEDDEEEEMEP